MFFDQSTLSLDKRQKKINKSSIKTFTIKNGYDEKVNALERGLVTYDSKSEKGFFQNFKEFFG